MVHSLNHAIRKRPLNLALKVTISIGLLVYLSTFIDLDEIKRLDRSTWLAVLTSTVLYFFLLLFMAQRWRLLVLMQKPDVFSFLQSYNGYLIGMFFNIFMPGAIGGDIYRIKYCQEKTDINLRNATLVIFVERLFGISTLFLVFGVGIYLNMDFLVKIDQSAVMLSVGLIILVLVTVTSKYILSRYITIDTDKFIVLITLSVIPHLVEIMNLMIVAKSFGVDLKLSQLFFVVPLVYLATVLPISLGGLGVREGVLAGLLTIYGVELQQGIMISLMMFIVLLFVGVVGMFQMFRKIQRLERLFYGNEK